MIWSSVIYWTGAAMAVFVFVLLAVSIYQDIKSKTGHERTGRIREYVLIGVGCLALYLVLIGPLHGQMSDMYYWVTHTSPQLGPSVNITQIVIGD